MRREALESFPPDVRDKVRETFDALHQLVNMPMTRPQAVEVRQSITMRAGVLASKHQLNVSVTRRRKR